MLSLYTTCESNGSKLELFAGSFSRYNGFCVSQREANSESTDSRVSGGRNDRRSPELWVTTQHLSPDTKSPSHPNMVWLRKNPSVDSIVFTTKPMWIKTGWILKNSPIHSKSLLGGLEDLGASELDPSPPPSATTASQVNACFSVASSSSKNTGDLTTQKTLESGSLGLDVLVVGSSQKMPRQSIFGEDYGLTPTLPLHRFLSDCSGPKELYIKWFWLKCYYRACGKKISTAHLESPSCDQ